MVALLKFNFDNCLSVIWQHRKIWWPPKGRQNNVLYESFEIERGVRIGYMSQPNILVPLLVCNVARSEYIMSKLTRYFCKRKSFLKKAYSKAVPNNDI